jgi:osmotically-inducible protein OsmY
VYGYVLAALVGAVAAYFLDPDRGRSRRAVTRDRLRGAARRGAREIDRTARQVEDRARRPSESARWTPTGNPEIDDATLAQKVMSEVFRDDRLPKGDVNVNSEYGVVYLRGEIEDPELIAEIVERTRDVDGVVDVENLLHLPGETAPRS